jgi:hypothetical protein
MNTAVSLSMSNRIAAGVTAAYVRDLSRRAAPSPGERRRPGGRISPEPAAASWSGGSD